MRDTPARFVAESVRFSVRFSVGSSRARVGTRLPTKYSRIPLRHRSIHAGSTRRSSGLHTVERHWSHVPPVPTLVPNDPSRLIRYGGCTMPLAKRNPHGRSGVRRQVFKFVQTWEQRIQLVKNPDPPCCASHARIGRISQETSQPFSPSNWSTACARSPLRVASRVNGIRGWFVALRPAS